MVPEPAFVVHVDSSNIKTGDSVEVSGVTTPFTANGTWTVIVFGDGTEIKLVNSAATGDGYSGTGLIILALSGARDDMYECHPYKQWIADGGWCSEDIEYDPATWTLGKQFYPAPPMVEAVNAVPEGAKTPPADTFKPCSTTESFTGRVCNYWGVGDVGFRPWLVWLNEEGCVCGGGRFVESYRSDGVSCVTAEREI